MQMQYRYIIRRIIFRVLSKMNFRVAYFSSIILHTPHDKQIIISMQDIEKTQVLW